LERDEEMSRKVHEEEAPYFLLEGRGDDDVKNDMYFIGLSQQLINSKENILKLR
jgi:hypothetical protein